MGTLPDQCVPSPRSPLDLTLATAVGRGLSSCTPLLVLCSLGLHPPLSPVPSVAHMLPSCPCPCAGHSAHL